MFTSIITALGGQFITGFFDDALKAFVAYNNRQISKDDCIKQVQIAMISAARDIEVAYADALAKTYASFMDALKSSKVLQRGWAVVLYVELFVLFWSQWAVPMLFSYGLLPGGWHAGTTAEWSYLLLIGLVGLGPVVLKAGPGAGNVTERLKGLVGK